MWVLVVPYLGIVKGSACGCHGSQPCQCPMCVQECVSGIHAQPRYWHSLATGWASKWESSNCIHQPGRETPGPLGHQAELQRPGQSNIWAPEPARVRGLVTSLSRNMSQAHICYKCLNYSYTAETLWFDFTINILSK